MMNKKIGVLLLFALLVSFGAKAQLATSMRINEVLVINEDNFVDDYGKRHGWIELYNSSAGTVNIAGCFLTDDKNNPKKYPIPKGDVLTQIPPGQHVLFWADNEPDRGTFHVSFSLDPTKENYVALYNADGKTLIDEVTIPAGQVADVSFGRIIDGKEEWAQLTKVTPSTNNLTLDSNEKIDNFKENDSWGIGMTITAMAHLLQTMQDRNPEKYSRPSVLPFMRSATTTTISRIPCSQSVRCNVLIHPGVPKYTVCVKCPKSNHP